MAFRTGVVVGALGDWIHRIAFLSAVALVTEQALVLPPVVIELRLLLKQRRDEFGWRRPHWVGDRRRRLVLPRLSGRPLAGDESAGNKAQESSLSQTCDNQLSFSRSAFHLRVRLSKTSFASRSGSPALPLWH